jgi:hypothetical protein
MVAGLAGIVAKLVASGGAAAEGAGLKADDIAVLAFPYADDTAVPTVEN